LNGALALAELHLDGLGLHQAAQVVAYEPMQAGDQIVQWPPQGVPLRIEAAPPGQLLALAPHPLLKSALYSFVSRLMLFTAGRTRNRDKGGTRAATDKLLVRIANSILADLDAVGRKGRRLETALTFGPEGSELRSGPRGQGVEQVFVHCYASSKEVARRPAVHERRA